MNIPRNSDERVRRAAFISKDAVMTQTALQTQSDFLSSFFCLFHFLIILPNSYIEVLSPGSLY